MITQSELKNILHYDPDTGLMKWVVNHKRVRAGSIAGCVNARGYIQVGIARRMYFAHRLAFLYQTGGWPPVHVDHINGLKTDNRWCNLRPVTPAENTKNAARSSSNKSGVTGVSWAARLGKWRATIKAEGSLKYLGVFDDLDEAASARKSAEQKYGFHKNHGRSSAEFT